jgi:hypothetical protein
MIASQLSALTPEHSKSFKVTTVAECLFVQAVSFASISAPCAPASLFAAALWNKIAGGHIVIRHTELFSRE